MTLPFGDDDKKNQRKYQCFVCGMMFDSYQEYKDHIINEHVVSRDYVICPQCNAPVRDLKLHWKVKHPNFKFPKVAQTSAFVWREFAPSKKKKTKKPKFHEGWYHSNKMNKKLHYRSGYEAKLYEYMDHDIEIQSFTEEPFEIEYIHEGKSHRYKPDLVVQFIDNRVEVWEVKPANQTNLEVNRNKWRAAKKACEQRGWKFIVMTEKGIEKMKQKISRQKRNRLDD